MFEKLAKFRPRDGRGQAQITAANDNLHAVDRRARRPRLVCRWYLNEGTDRLACRWELEGSDEPSGSLGRDPRFHKSFFELSYQPGLSKLAGQIDGGPLVQGTNARWIGSLPVLHPGHSRMPSKVGIAVLPCCCERLAITLDLSSGDVSQKVG
jgi:hypothetical protein